MIKKTMGIIGGSGALGTAILTLMKKTRWKTINFDYIESKLATRNFLLDKSRSMSEQIEAIDKSLTSTEDEFDAMISLAGGMTGNSSIADVAFFKEYEKKYKENVESALLRNDFG